MVSPLYRGRQFFIALRPRIRPAELAVVREVLSPDEAALFFAMDLCDQRHAIDVMRHILHAGEQERDLLVAALLHDCAKGRVPLWLRVLHVVAPPAVRLLALGLGREAWSGDGLRPAAYRLVHHAALSADLAAGAGASPAAVRYISGRGEPHERAKISLLKAADDAS